MLNTKLHLLFYAHPLLQFEQHILGIFFSGIFENLEHLMIKIKFCFQWSGVQLFFSSFECATLNLASS